MTKLVTTTLMFLLWLPATMAGFAGSDGFVVCVGADGHLAVEATNHDSCGRPDSEGGGAAAEQHASSIGMQDRCADLAVAGNLGVVHGKRGSERPLSPPAGAPYPPALLPSVAACTATIAGRGAIALAYPPVPSPHLPRLATLMLRL